MFGGATYLAVVSFLEYAFLPAVRGNVLNLRDGLVASAFQFFLFWFTWRYAQALDSLSTSSRNNVPLEPVAGARHLLINTLRPMYRLPVWMHVLISFVLFYVIAFILIFTQPLLVVLVPISVGILGIYSGPLRRWLESVFGREQPESTRASWKVSLTWTVIAAILLIATTIAYVDTMIEGVFVQPESWTYGGLSTLLVYVIMVVATLYAILLYHDYSSKRSEMRKKAQSPR